MFMMILLSSMIFTIMNHPMNMMMSLILYSFFSSILLKLISNNNWPAYFMFLILITGLLLIFVYMSSITYNEPLIINNKMNKFIMIPFIILIFLNPFLMKFIESPNPCISIAPLNSMKYSTLLLYFVMMMLIYILMFILSVLKPDKTPLKIL
uniref:NADH dehydrogenase subunit 6 n=1 Tax=Pseudogarypus banksi TaxID=1131925 RepID=H9MFJ1_9ARAC|nr:NADH dehydrogenase subunit 6 [Pseudogarypus banksi]